jgi:hypothetical protein
MGALDEARAQTHTTLLSFFFQKKNQKNDSVPIN